MICRTRPGPFKAGVVNMSRIFPLLLIFAAAARAEEASYPLSGINETHLQTLKTYCVECHSEKGKFRGRRSSPHHWKFGDGRALAKSAQCPEFGPDAAGRRETVARTGEGKSCG